ncbi:hypothetical protein TWF679_001346 [Orbilia oligospora]|uniref:Uncharacterized protein n=1 Tax=Orbilia oligospora TaxID=2813651 RepID=A0A8H8UVN0_ORBOL|nr:hypothetical protein TWF679_001346 [Orbilia oligospora]
MPRKSGTVHPKRAGKKSVMSREQVLKMEKIEKIRSSAPLQIMDGLKALRGRPKRQWPNPMTRLNPYEDVPMVVKPQTTAEPQIERKSKGPLPPLKIVMESAPGTKRSKRNVTVTKFDEEPEEVKTDALGGASLLAQAEAGLPHHGQVPPGYPYEDFRRTSKSSSEAPSDTSTPSGSYRKYLTS